uniref:Uncharacterized protein n=1 Tax=Arundo donax TaxID=35708 RepID=A0A0A9DR61_ARUDO
MVLPSSMPCDLIILAAPKRISCSADSHSSFLMFLRLHPMVSSPYELSSLER